MATHQAWYGSGPPPAPPPSFPLRQPYYETEQQGPPARRRRRGCGCGFVHSVVRQFSFVIPVILVIVTGYVYGRDDSLGGLPAGDPVWVPLYLTIPISSANIIWNIAVMANHRRAPHTGRPFPQAFHFLTELVLTVGAVVCFIFMVVVLTSREGDLPRAYHRSLAWLLGMQMIASGFLCGRAGVEVWRDRREQREEAYAIH